MLTFFSFWIVFWLAHMTFEWWFTSKIVSIHPFYFVYTLPWCIPHLQSLLHKPIVKYTCRRIFQLGSLLMLSILTLSPVLFLYLLSQLHVSESYSIRNEDQSGHISSLVVPLIPLVNIPHAYLFSFWLLTWLSSLIHELGHGTAALMENVQVERVGFFIVMFFPGAYVNLDSYIQKVDVSARIRVFSAGIAFNFIAALFAFIVLNSLPTLLFLIYRRSSGVVISSLEPSSSLSSQLSYGTTILSLNGYIVNSHLQFQQVLHTIDQSTSFMSHHLKLHLLQKYDSSYLETYLRPTNESQANAFAEYIVMNTGYCVQMELPYPVDTSCCIDLLTGNVRASASDTCFLNSREWTMASYELFCDDIRHLYEPFHAKFNQHCRNDNDCLTGNCLKALTKR